MARNNINLKDKIKKISSHLKFNKLKNNKQVVIYLVCLLIATVLWFLNALEKDYSTSIWYPVRYIDPPNQQFLSNEPPSKLELKVDAHGFTLLRYKMSLTFSPILLNLSSITKDTPSNNGSYSIPTQSLLRIIRSQVSNEITVREVNPEILLIDLDSLKSKVITVKAAVDFSFKPQFNLKTPVSLSPAEVNITGPAHTIDTLRFLYTESKTFDDLDISVERNLNILHPKNTSIVPKNVLLKIDVEKFTEKEIKVPIQIKNKPDNAKIKLFPSEVKISCLVGLSNFENITSNDFKAVVDYNSITGESTNLAINIESQPKFIELIHSVPKSVEYLVETN